jgi:hypothetical protein
MPPRSACLQAQTAALIVACNERTNARRQQLKTSLFLMSCVLRSLYRKLMNEGESSRYFIYFLTIEEMVLKGKGKF